MDSPHQSRRNSQVLASVPKIQTGHHINGSSALTVANLKRRHDISRTIKELTSTRKRLSDANLTSNETIEFFTRIKNRRIKSTSLSDNPNYSKYNSYTPYDRAKLLQRINSYNILNWSIDDAKLNPLECARHGWACVGNNGSVKNQIHCVTCSASMIIQLDNSNKSHSSGTSFELFQFDDEDVDDGYDEESFQEEVTKNLVQFYLKKLTEEHKDSCPWKSYPSPLSTYQIQSYDYQDILEHLKKTLALLNRNKAFLKAKNFTRKLEISELASLQRWSNYEYDDTVLMIALLGWELKVQTFGLNQLVFLQCHSCNRRVLLGDLKVSHSTEVDGYGKDDVTVNFSPSKTLAGTVYPALFIEEEDEDVDLLDEHKDWCAIKTGYKTILQFV